MGKIEQFDCFLHCFLAGIERMSNALPDGVDHWPGYLDLQSQRKLLDIIRDSVAEAPLFRPRMPRTGKAMSVQMTNLGSLGWVTDKEGGYRYQPTHPITGKPWPEMPQVLLDIWKDLSGYTFEPEACLVNFYE